LLIEVDEAMFCSLLVGCAPAPYRLPDANLESPEILEMLHNLAITIRPHFLPAAWLIVEGVDAVGLCSVLRPPADGRLEIGYGIAPAHRNKGAARRAIADLLSWARAAPNLTAITAETGTQNTASQRVLQRNGFARVGTRTDPQDGELICWQATLF
jgi:RimJ/RimL family protein N-acetyltransferase